MGVIVCANCSNYVDMDFETVFLHKNGNYYCECCAEELDFTTYDGVWE